MGSFTSFVLFILHGKQTHVFVRRVLDQLCNIYCIPCIQRYLAQKSTIQNTKDVQRIPKAIYIYTYQDVDVDIRNMLISNILTGWAPQL